jgi:hypothetical protein
MIYRHFISLFTQEFDTLKNLFLILIWTTLKKDVDVRLGVKFDYPDNQ